MSTVVAWYLVPGESAVQTITLPRTDSYDVLNDSLKKLLQCESVETYNIIFRSGGKIYVMR